MTTTTTPRNNRSRWTTAAVLALLALGVLLTVLFGLRATRSLRDFREMRGRPPREARGDIAPWMTVPYVAHAYAVPVEFLFQELGIEQTGNERRNLMQLERRYFADQPRGTILERTRAAVELYYADSVVPTPIIPDPEDAPLPALPGAGPRDGPPDDLRPGDLPPDAPQPPNGPEAPPAGAGTP